MRSHSPIISIALRKSFRQGEPPYRGDAGNSQEIPEIGYHKSVPAV